MGLWDWRLRKAPTAAPARPPGQERRRAARFPCALKTTVQPVSLVGANTRTLRARDLSSTGISLLGPAPFPVGTFLVIALTSPTKKVAVTQVALVVRHFKIDGDQPVLGCRWQAELAAEALAALVR